MSKMIARSDGICPLLSALPVEIRLQIYDYVLFENGNFFSLDDEEGNSVPTLFPKLRAPRTRHQRRPRQTLERPDSQVANDARGIRTSRNGNIMSLLLTSKQIYDEAASHLYARAFFRLRGIHSTIQFINTVEPAHLALVRSLKLVWDDQGWASAPEFDTPTLRAAWPSLCDALATQFHGLENLYVALGMPSNAASVERLYLRELRRVRQVRRNFKVCIPMNFLARYYSVEDSDHEHEHDDEFHDHDHDHDGAAGVATAFRPWQQDKDPFEVCRHTAGEVCQVRREVIAAEWLGESRPPTPRLKIHMPSDHTPELHPWADGTRETGGEGSQKGLLDDDWLDAVISGKL